MKTRRQNSCVNILSAVTQIVEITKVEIVRSTGGVELSSRGLTLKLHRPTCAAILLRELGRLLRPTLRNSPFLDRLFLVISVALLWGGDIVVSTIWPLTCRRIASSHTAMSMAQCQMVCRRNSIKMANNDLDQGLLGSSFRQIYL